MKFIVKVNVDYSNENYDIKLDHDYINSLSWETKKGAKLWCSYFMDRMSKHGIVMSEDDFTIIQDETIYESD